jgi:hypothetical protein
MDQIQSRVGTIDSTALLSKSLSLFAFACYSSLYIESVSQSEAWSEGRNRGSTVLLRLGRRAPAEQKKQRLYFSSLVVLLALSILEEGMK